MITTRQYDTKTEEASKEAVCLATSGNTLTRSTTASVLTTLQTPPSEVKQTNPVPQIPLNNAEHRSIEQSFFFIKSELKPTLPPGTLVTNDLTYDYNISEMIKTSMGILPSSHDIKIVRMKDSTCDLIYCPEIPSNINLTKSASNNDAITIPQNNLAHFPSNIDLTKLPTTSNSYYIMTSDKKIFYIDNKLKRRTPLVITDSDYDNLFIQLNLATLMESKKNDDLCIIRNLTNDQLYAFTRATTKVGTRASIREAKKEAKKTAAPGAPTPSATTTAAKPKHLDGMGFYKESVINSKMISLETANGSAYQLLGVRHFPISYAVVDKAGNYLGVYSKLLPGFEPNRDCPIEKDDIEISSLKNMIKERDEHDLAKLKKIFTAMDDLLVLTKREVNSQDWLPFRVWDKIKNTGIYLLGNEDSAVYFNPKLEEFSKKNKHTITFGDLEKIRQLLINRKKNIERVKDSYTATQHKHPEELKLINQAIEQLNIILLDDVALYIREIRKLDKKLKDAWVDIEAEKSNPNSPYANMYITEGLVAPLSISLTDIQNFRNQRGLAIGLTSRYFMMDPDGHAKNFGSDDENFGCNVDGDLAANPLTFRFKNINKKPGVNDFAMDIDDFINFPNLTFAKFRYWPTSTTTFENATDKTLSSVSDKFTKNYFTDNDYTHYTSLENEAVFNFQKYVNLIIFSLTNKEMYTACAKLHMDDQIPSIDENGNTLPLKNGDGKRQDLQQQWINCLSDRASEARKLSLQLPHVKKMFERHSELILEMVEEHFQLFLDDSSLEYDKEAQNLLKSAINIEDIKKSFAILQNEVLMSPVSEMRLDKPMGVSM